MADWRIFKTHVSLLPHPNADALELIRAGEFQFVAQKGLYQNGDPILVVPEKSLLPEAMRAPFEKYLGPNGRVRAVRLRGERSEGVILPDAWPELPFERNIAKELGIAKYEAPIPANMAGEMAPMPDWVPMNLFRHDVYQPGVFVPEFVPGEEVLITEKIHGSQINILLSPEGKFVVTSKGLLERGLCLRESPTNLYWRCLTPDFRRDLLDWVQNTMPIRDRLRFVHLVGEAIPCQGAAWTYGAKHPQALFYKVIAKFQQNTYSTTAGLGQEDRVVYAAGDWPDFIPHVPVVGIFNWEPTLLDAHRNGKETVTGQALHHREGIVVQPWPLRLSSQGRELIIKSISDKFAGKETGEELS